MSLKVTKVTDRLFQVENVFDENIMQLVNAIDWTSLSWHRGLGQESWNRRRIDANINEVKTLSSMMVPFIEQINDILNIDIDPECVIWWLDEPGFTCGTHIDEFLPKTIQLYMISPNENLGTSFYNTVNRDDLTMIEWMSKIEQSLLVKFKSIPNTGYVMLNYPETDGTTPLLWHNMNVPVPENSIRLSCYYNLTKQKLM